MLKLKKINIHFIEGAKNNFRMYLLTMHIGMTSPKRVKERHGLGQIVGDLSTRTLVRYKILCCLLLTVPPISKIVRECDAKRFLIDKTLCRIKCFISLKFRIKGEFNSNWLCVHVETVYSTNCCYVMQSGNLFDLL